MGSTPRTQPIVPGHQPLKILENNQHEKRSQFPSDRSRTIPYLRRIKASIVLSGSKRFAHFASVASEVTPYRALGVGASIAANMTRAQSSGVVFDFFCALVAPAYASESILE